MKNMRMLNGVLLLVAVGLLFLPGCRNVLTPPETGNVAGTGVGTLSLVLSRQGSERTIVPRPDIGEFVEFYLEFTPVSGGYENVEFSVRWTEGAGTIEIDEGDWNLFVTAYVAGTDGTPVVAATGSLYDIDIPSGETIAGDVTLYPIPEGTGTFSWNIVFPSSVIDASMEITRVDEGGTSDTVHLVFGGVTLSQYNPGSLTLDSGQYRVIFTLSHPLWQTAVISEILHVYQNMDSHFPETFGYEHFARTLLDMVLARWDGSEWDFEDSGIEAGHFIAMGIDGINSGNFDDVVKRFNDVDFVAVTPLPGSLGLPGLKALVDAVLIRMASEDDDFLGTTHADRTYAEAAIAYLAANGTTVLSFDWTDGYTVVVDIDIYGLMEFVFTVPIPLPSLTGKVSITGRPVVGLTLLANTDGLDGTGEISFQWMRYDEPIAYATNGTYTVQADDVGYAIIVRVSRDGLDGYIFSEPTDCVEYIEGPEDTSLVAQLAWLQTSARDNNTYIVELTGDEIVSSVQMALPTNRSDLTIVLVGSEPSTISLSNNGSLFTIGAGVTLVLDDNVTLMGRGANANPVTEYNNQPLVIVNSDGNLVINAGARITGNTNTSSAVGGVRVNNTGTLTMYGGEISGNATISGWDGGGVHILNGGTFNMRGGIIFNNSSSWSGGGVLVASGGIFRISDGIIYGNELAVATELRNTAANNGAALFNSGTAQRGRFDYGDGIGMFTSFGNLSTTNNTIHVGNGIIPVPPMEGNLAAQLAWLQNWAQDGGEYTIELSSDETIAPQTLPTGITITLRGIGEMRNVNLSDNGVLFTVGSGVTLILDENVTLMGRGPNANPVTANNTNHLVRINSDGTLIMNTGSRLTGNTNATTAWDSGGGGVRVNNGGAFILDGGEISGNSTTTGTGWSGAPGNGGGVFVDNGGRFDMRGGTISNNDGQVGGGVFVAQANFTVSGAPADVFRIGGGIIHGNDAAEGFRNTSRTVGSASLGNSGTVQRGIFNNAGEFLSLGTLAANDNFTIEIIDGVFRSFTVTFNANSGEGTVPAPQTVRIGLSATLPSGSGLSKDGYFFAGWNTNADGTGDGFNSGMAFTPTDDVTLYAVWMYLGDSNVPGETLAAQLSWLQSNAQTGGRYHIVLTGNVSQSPHSLAFNGQSDIVVTLIGGEVMRTLSLSSSGSMFSIGSGVTLVLDHNVTLQGIIGNNLPLVMINTAGTLVMNNGARIIGNTNGSWAASGGGAVRVNGGTFIMNDGEISGNVLTDFEGDGSGVNVASGTFTMHGGIISGNTAGRSGGGVHIAFGATFNKQGGTILGNRGKNHASASSGGGGGVNNAGTFRISGGIIFGNEATIQVAYRNTLGAGSGVALLSTGTSQRGTFNDAGVFTSLGTLSTTNNTITVTNGVLQ